MSAAQPTTPKRNTHGAPMGTRKVPVTPKNAASTAEDTKQQAEETGEQATSQIPGKDVANDATNQASEQVQDATKDKPQEKLDEAIDLGDDAAGEATGQVNEGAEKATDGVEKAQEGVEGTAEDWKPEDNGTEKSEDLQSKVPDEAQSKVDEAQSEVPDDAQTEIPDDAQSQVPESQIDEAQSQVPDDAQSQVPESQIDEAQSQVPDDQLSEEEGGLRIPESVKSKASKAGSEVSDAATKVPDEAQSQVPEGEEAEVPKDAEAEVPKDAESELPEGVEIGEDGERLLLQEDGAEPLSFAVLEGKKLNKGGFVVDDQGNPIGKLIEGDAKKLAGKVVDAEGRIWNDSGKVIGKAEPIPVDDQEKAETAPFEDFAEAVVDASGKILFEGRKIGIVTEGDPKKLAGKKVDPDGDILDKHGNVIGKAIREDEEEPEPEPEPEEEKIDCSALAGLKVNKSGNVINDNGRLVGRVVSGALKSLVGKTVDAEGNIYNETGKVIGRAEPIPDDEKEEQNETPFEDFPGSLVEKNGDVVYQGKVIGKVVEGDPKKLAGKSVDPEGDIVDKNGTVVGKAERWEEEEVPEEVVDKSILAGKRVNKAGNVVDSSGVIYGKLVEGDVKALAGKMCDKQGFVRNEAGDVVGKAELVPEGDREGLKTGPFADFPGCTVTKDGKVICDQGIVGRLIEGNAAKLFGKSVDEDGDVVDKNGNVLGKAERWEEEEVKKDVNPMSGLKVNKAGEVYDTNGELIGKLTEGTPARCAGFKIDDDGDVVDQKGNAIGHVSLIQDIPEPEPEPEEEPEPEPEPEETEEEKAERLQKEEDKKLAIQMGNVIQNALDRIQPVLKMITETIEKAERQKPEDVDQQKVVDEVKPLIEEGGRILTETNGAIRGLDPDGRIAGKAKHKTAAREATPEEYRLADLLKELTGTVTQTIDNAKKKIADWPHAKKELNPLWGLLSEPLFQILAGVGMLLSGVLGLVAQLLNGLGLGGLVRGLLGGLGITRVLDGLGLGKILSPITGSKQGK